MHKYVRGLMNIYVYIYFFLFLLQDRMESGNMQLIQRSKDASTEAPDNVNGPVHIWRRSSIPRDNAVVYRKIQFRPSIGAPHPKHLAHTKGGIQRVRGRQRPQVQRPWSTRW